MISVLILTKNEEKMIGNCLESIKDLADEIIVLDNNSDDKTREITKKYTDKIFQKEFEGFDKERNFLNQKSKGDWIFYIDADERVPVNLRKEIRNATKSERYSAYAISRKNILLGKWLKHGGWWPDYQIRLFRKSDFATWEGELHERPNFKGKLAYLKEPLTHLTHRDIVSMMEKTAQWSKIEAKLRLDAHHPKISGWRLTRVVLTEFFGRFFKKQGFRDGTEGWLESIYQAFSIFITYARLWEMQRENNLKETYKKIDEELTEGGFK